MNKSTEAELDGEHLFKVSAKDSLKTSLFCRIYLCTGEAPSKKKMFDFILLFKPNLRILKSKVLIYREEYGLQIGSQRWLKQFIGLGINDRASYGKNIDAISGATISARSMTRVTDEVLQTLKTLKEAALLVD